MSWLAALRGKRVAVDERRWVMLDVETSGLDARRDQLLAIAAIGLQVDWPAKRLSIAPGDSFEVVLQQERPSARDNILLAPGSVRPTASAMPIIVAAVPMVMQVPWLRAMPASISAQALAGRRPARRSSQYLKASEPEPSTWPFQLPRSIGPAGR